jgi:hypothetical protein
LTSQINSIGNQILNLYSRLEAIQKDSHAVSNEEISLKSAKRKYYEMNAHDELADKTVIEVQEKRIKNLIETLNKDETQLKHQRKIIGRNMGIIERKIPEVLELQSQIHAIFKKKEGLENKYKFEKRKIIEQLCVENQWLIENEELGIHSLTETGAIKYLELKKYIRNDVQMVFDHL